MKFAVMHSDTRADFFLSQFARSMEDIVSDLKHSLEEGLQTKVAASLVLAEQFSFGGGDWRPYASFEVRCCISGEAG